MISQEIKIDELSQSRRGIILKIQSGMIISENHVKNKYYLRPEDSGIGARNIGKNNTIWLLNSGLIQKKYALNEDVIIWEITEFCRRLIIHVA